MENNIEQLKDEVQEMMNNFELQTLITLKFLRIYQNNLATHALLKYRYGNIQLYDLKILDKTAINAHWEIANIFAEDGDIIIDLRKWLE